MKRMLLLLVIALIYFKSESQVINTTTFSDMLSELKMSTKVKNYDIALKGNRADGEPMVKVLKVLMTDGVRYEHWFDGKNYKLFCTKIIDPTSEPAREIQRMVTKGSIEKVSGNDGMYKMKCCLIYVDVEEDDFGNKWMRFFGLPNE